MTDPSPYFTIDQIDISTVYKLYPKRPYGVLEEHLKSMDGEERSRYTIDVTVHSAIVITHKEFDKYNELYAELSEAQQGEDEIVRKEAQTISGTPLFQWLYRPAGLSGNGNESLLMTLSSSGELGVNTSDTQGYQFAVNGSAIATSMTVQSYVNWPDYVLKKEYHLMPLFQLRSFIEENHHLPDVPSEQEVEKQGQNLGEMNKLLLKKVEELTLYLIEKDQRDSEQQQQIDAQSVQLKSQQEQLDQLKTQLSNILKQQKN
jgi:hypothetical protein